MYLDLELLHKTVDDGISVRKFMASQRGVILFSLKVTGIQCIVVSRRQLFRVQFACQIFITNFRRCLLIIQPNI